MDKPKISVIVPVYNVKKYLVRCINSLVNQTYKNIEIILVDDGSRDGSGIICDQLRERDSRIKVIHKTNGGLSSARNMGLANSSGDYISFIDSDDWIELDTYQYCLNLMKSNGASCAEFDTIMVKDEKPINQRNEKIAVYTGKEILQYYMESTTKTGSYSVCRCLFPAEAISNIEFRQGKVNEDIDFKYKVLSRCKRLVVSNLYKYHYFQTGNSLSVGGLKKRDFDLYEAGELLCELTRDEDFGTISYLGQVKKARTPFSLLSKIAYCGIDDESIDEKAIIKKLIVEHRKNVMKLIFSPIPVSRKILAIMYCINFSLSKKIIVLFRKYIVERST